MAKQVIIIEEAWQDINIASDYYEKVSVALRKRFEMEIIRYLIKLETGIASYAVYKRNYKRVNLSAFPFKIYYKETEDTIIVAAVIHAARGRRFLKGRLP